MADQPAPAAAEGTTEGVDRHFLDTVGGLRARPDGDGLDLATDVSDARLLELFDAQAGSRHLDLAARRLRATGDAFYTIGSSGHEGNVAVAAALHRDDPALLHYRSGAFYLERASQYEHSDGIRDVLLGLVAAEAEPIAGGRHKVFGHPDYAVIPQTSTIASHLPRAVGVAFAIDRAAKLKVPSTWRPDALAVCSFGDASANHSTAVGAINTACQVAYQGLPMPILFVCEDNGLGISVPTPNGWIQQAYGHRPGLEYFTCDGSDLAQSLRMATKAAAYVRRRRRPAFLHLRTVRYMAHAGSDAEIGYRTRKQIEGEYARDPLLGAAQLLIDRGVLDGAGVRDRYTAIADRVRAVAAEVVSLPKLTDAAQIVRPLAEHRPGRVASAAASAPDAQRREEVFGAKPPESEGPLTLAMAINRSLADQLIRLPQAIVFGEDVGRKGGVYGVTAKLQARFSAARVFDTLLDEQSILGLGLGGGVSGLIGIPEIQYLAYLHNAVDQLRGEGATLPFFSNGRFRNPMVVRVAGYAYQKGFGGHFHNDDAVAALRDIPGLIVASPARPDDAAAMLRTCLAAAETDGRLSVFLEPIALYHTRDLHQPGDGGWLAPYAAPEDWADAHVPLGRARTYGDGRDATLLTFGNGLFMSLRVAARLAREGIDVRVVDLRWLAPLPVDDIVEQAAATGRVLVVDETRRTGGVSEQVVTALVDAGFGGSVARVTSRDTFIPLGDAANVVLLDEDTIADAVRRLVAAGATTNGSTRTPRSVGQHRAPEPHDGLLAGAPRDTI